MSQMHVQQRTTRAVIQSRLAVLLRNWHRPTFIWKMVIWKKQKEVVIMQWDHSSRNCWLRMVTTRKNVKNKRLCLILDRRRWCIPSHQMFRELNNREFIFKTRTWCGVRVVDDFVYVITIKEVMFYFNNQPSWWYRRQLFPLISSHHVKILNFIIYCVFDFGEGMRIWNVGPLSKWWLL